LSKPLERYGLIGNTISAALIADDGSIDWLCLPRFDSPACFAALLGTDDNGRWRLAPEAKKYRSSQAYVPGTAVLETRFETATGAVSVTDFMPRSKEPRHTSLVRIVRGVRGQVAMAMDLVLRFNYGQAIPWVRRRDYGLSAVAGADAVELHTAVPLMGRDLATSASFTVREGDAVPFTLSYHPSYDEPQFVPDRDAALQETVAWWRAWSANSDFPTDKPRWHDAVIRSLITLKLLTYAPTGAIIAAPTTSLPEAIGGTRNWDYRYCWLRDSALTLHALMETGHKSEAEAWRQWVHRATAGHPKQLQILYGVEGTRWLPECGIDWLSGYENSRPVRVGNGAARQTQLDVYGEISETLYAARQGGLTPPADGGAFHALVLEYLETIWRSPGQGIWEMRGPARAFTYSRVMCWVAFDRAVRLAEQFGTAGPVDRWRSVRDQIHADVCTNGYDARRNTFTQYYGGTTLDASLLLLPRVGFVDARDPRFVGTLAAIEGELVKDGWVMRYSTDDVNDGVGGAEGAFLACSFWLADAYALSGARERAVEVFERLLSLRNGLGLLSEEYDTARRRLVGNFPQGFSHLALISSAIILMRGGPDETR
jgi:GH15 family glucan-1,4-alpha-glucosidase